MVMLNKKYSVENKSGTVVRKVKTLIYPDGSTPVEASVTETSGDGLKAWSTQFGRVTQRISSYTGGGNMMSVTTNPDGSTTTDTYQNGKLMSSVHSVLGTTTYVYDGFNRMTGVVQTVNGQTQTNSSLYNNGDQVSKVTDSLGRETAYTYDALGRRTKTTLPGNRVVNYTYATTGELLTVSGADTYSQTFIYDYAGRMKTLTTGNGAVTTWNYSDRGFMTSKVYADNSSVTYTYRPDGQPLTRTWARGIVTTYGYDTGGSLNGVTYSDDTPSLSFTLNTMANPASITDATGTRTLTYNSDLSLANEGTVSYTYDALGRRSAMAYGSNTTSYTYDGMSRLATVSDGTRTATYSRVSGANMLSGININNVVNVTKAYDNGNRLTNISSVAGSNTYSYGYTYDVNGRRTNCALPDSGNWTYQYDDKGQVISAVKTSSSGNVLDSQSFKFTYDEIGNFQTEVKNGNTSAYTSNNLNQYTSRTFPGVAKISGRANADATVYIQKGSERPMKVALSNGEFERTFKFDNSAAPVSQLFKIYAVKPGTTDLVKMKEQTVNIPQSPAALTYDADGNTLSDGKLTYTWNAENSLIKVEETGKLKKEYTYDYMGRKATEKIYSWVNGDWSLTADLKRIYDGWNLVAVLNASDASLLKFYTWGEDLSGTLQGAGGVGGLLYETNSSGTYYPVYDGNGNITVYVNSTSAEVAKYAYGPFGKPYSQSGSKAMNFDFMFSTKEYDRSTGILSYQLRPLKVDIRHWLSRDLIEESGGVNLYGFIGNNPVNAYDLLGLDLRRTGEAMAEVCVSQGKKDPIFGSFLSGGGKGKTPEEAIAQLVKLNEDESQKWLKEIDGSTPVKKAEWGKTYKVPNTVVILVGNKLGTAYPFMWSEAKFLKSKYEGKKFKVELIDAATAGADLTTPILRMAKTTMWGFAYLGHGYAGDGANKTRDILTGNVLGVSRSKRGYAVPIQTGIFLTEPVVILGPSEISGGSYKKALISILACFSDEGTGNDNWSTAVSKYGSLFTVQGMDFAPLGLMNFKQSQAGWSTYKWKAGL